MRVRGNSGSPSVSPEAREARADHRGGQDRRREPGAHDRADRAEILGKEPRPRHAAAPPASAVFGRSPPEAGRAAQRKRDRRSLLQSGTARRRPDQRLLAQQFEALRVPVVVRDQRQFKRAGGDLRREFGRRFADDRDLDQRMAAIEARENLGQERFGVVVRNPEPDARPSGPCATARPARPPRPGRCGGRIRSASRPRRSAVRRARA